MHLSPEITASAEAIQAIRRNIHAHPELRFEENRTADLVAEALTRTVLQDESLRPVSVGGRSIKLSQFADDTQFFLKGYEDLKRLWEIIHQYEEATGMRANKKKNCRHAPR